MQASTPGEHLPPRSPAVRNNRRAVGPARSISCRTRSERPQIRKRDDPRPPLLETTRVDGVKAPRHRGTPRSRRRRRRRRPRTPSRSSFHRHFYLSRPGRALRGMLLSFFVVRKRGARRSGGACAGFCPPVVAVPPLLQACAWSSRRGREDRCGGFGLFGAALVLVRGAWAPAAAVSLSISSASAACSLTDQSPAQVNGRRLQHEEGRSDGDQRREDRHRCGGRGEDLCVCSEHWQLNRD